VTGISAGSAAYYWKAGTGATFAPKALAHKWNGMFDCGFSTSHVDTLGPLRCYWYAAASHLALWEDFHVVTANKWDSEFGADVRHADVTQLQGAGASASIFKGDLSTLESRVGGTTLLRSTWTDARAPYLDELAAANLPADIDTLKSRVGATFSFTGGDVKATLDSETVVLTNFSAANAALWENMLDGTGGETLYLGRIKLAGSTSTGLLDIDNAGGPGIDTRGTTYGLYAAATGNGHGIAGVGNSTGSGMMLDGGISGGHGLAATSFGGMGSGKGISSSIAFTGDITGSVSGSVGNVTDGVNVNRVAGETVSAVGGLNFQTFVQNAGSTTTKVLDNVGTASGSGGTSNVNVVGIAGTSIPAIDGVNWHTFFNAAGSTSTKDQDDVGTASVGSSVTANVMKVAGRSVSNVAGLNFYTFFNAAGSTSTKDQDDVGTASSTGGTVNVNVERIAGHTVHDTSGINFNTFHYAAGSTSTKDQDDIGTALAGGTTVNYTIDVTNITETEA